MSFVAEFFTQPGHRQDNPLVRRPVSVDAMCNAQLEILLTHLQRQLEDCTDGNNIISQAFSLMLPNGRRVDFDIGQTQEKIEELMRAALMNKTIAIGQIPIVLREWPTLFADLANEGIPESAFASPDALEEFALHFCTRFAPTLHVAFPLYVILKYIPLLAAHPPQSAIHRVFLPFLTGEVSLYDEDLVLLCIQHCADVEPWAKNFCNSALPTDAHNIILTILARSDNDAVSTHAEKALQRMSFQWQPLGQMPRYTVAIA